jgi:hypothetical protein
MRCAARSTTIIGAVNPVVSVSTIIQSLFLISELLAWELLDGNQGVTFDNFQFLVLSNIEFDELVLAAIDLGKIGDVREVKLGDLVVIAIELGKLGDI